MVYNGRRVDPEVRLAFRDLAPRVADHVDTDITSGYLGVNFITAPPRGAFMTVPPSKFVQ
jgi:hypothetical protein